ncbi:hypothetical protein ACLBXX_15885 [Microbacterium sp. C23T]
MKPYAGPRFEATRLAEAEWVVHDRAYSVNDARRVVAHIGRAASDEYQVTWVRNLPLSPRYPSIRSVLDDVIACTPHNRKPVDIPHRPPAPAGLAAVV